MGFPHVGFGGGLSSIPPGLRVSSFLMYSACRFTCCPDFVWCNVWLEQLRFGAEGFFGAIPIYSCEYFIHFPESDDNEFDDYDNMGLTGKELMEPRLLSILYNNGVTNQIMDDLANSGVTALNRPN